MCYRAGATTSSDGASAECRYEPAIRATLTVATNEIVALFRRPAGKRVRDFYDPQRRRTSAVDARLNKTEILNAMSPADWESLLGSLDDATLAEAGLERTGAPVASALPADRYPVTVWIPVPSELHRETRRSANELFLGEEHARIPLELDVDTVLGSLDWDQRTWADTLAHIEPAIMSRLGLDRGPWFPTSTKVAHRPLVNDPDGRRSIFPLLPYAAPAVVQTPRG